MVTVSQVKAMGPELASVSDAFVQIYLDIVTSCFLGKEFWGDCYDTAVKLMTAHFVTVAGRGGASSSGPVTSERVGDLARSYGSFQFDGDIDELSTTPYGVMFITLRRTKLRTPFCV
jgi:hypothetical protein